MTNVQVQEEVMYVDEKGNPVSLPTPVSTMGSTGSSFSYPPQISGKTEKADLLDKIRPDAIVEVIRHRLMGEELINGKWQPVPELKSRALSKLGAWDIANLMLGVSSQNVALSKLNDKEIRQRTLEIVRTAQYMMLKNWKEYGITGVDQLFFVHQIVMSNTFITLKQPEGEGIRSLLKGTTHENRNITAEREERRHWGGVFRPR